MWWLKKKIEQHCIYCETECIGIFYADSTVELIENIKKCIKKCKGCDIETKYGAPVMDDLENKLKLYDYADPMETELKFSRKQSTTDKNLNDRLNIYGNERCNYCESRCTGVFHADSTAELIENIKKCIEKCNGCDIETNYGAPVMDDLENKLNLYDYDDPIDTELKWTLEDPMDRMEATHTTWVPEDLRERMEDTEVEWFPPDLPGQISHAEKLTALGHKFGGKKVVMDEMRESYKKGANFVTWLLCKAVESRMGIHSKVDGQLTREERINAALGNATIHNVGGQLYLSNDMVTQYNTGSGQPGVVGWTDLWYKVTGIKPDLGESIDMDVCKALTNQS